MGGLFNPRFTRLKCKFSPSCAWWITLEEPYKPHSLEMALEHLMTEVEEGAEPEGQISSDQIACFKTEIACLGMLDLNGFDIINKSYFIYYSIAKYWLHSHPTPWVCEWFETLQRWLLNRSIESWNHFETFENAGSFNDVYNRLRRSLLSNQSTLFICHYCRSLLIRDSRIHLSSSLVQKNHSIICWMLEVQRKSRWRRCPKEISLEKRQAWRGT